MQLTSTVKDNMETTTTIKDNMEKETGNFVK